MQKKNVSGDNFIIEKLQGNKTPIFLVINKIDKVHPEKIIGNY